MGIKITGRKRMLALIALVIVVAIGIWVLSRMGEEFPPPSTDLDVSRHEVVAVFGATGDVGDGVLEAVMGDPDVKKIHVITRRPPWRLEGEDTSGRVEMTTHMDYLDYTSLQDVLAEADAVYWAIGTSTANVTEEQYGVIHVDFPVAMVEAWLGTTTQSERSFHYVSGGGAAADSRMRWAREKARAEQALFDLAAGTDIRVVAYRPGMVIPAKERGEKYDGLKQMAGFSVPVKLGVRSVAIGEAMLEVTARGGELESGSILENRAILMYANGYGQRAGTLRGMPRP